MTVASLTAADPDKEALSAYIAEAGRRTWVIDGLPAGLPLREIRKVGVIGAGTMGGGISMNFASAGIPVTILETKQEALDRGLGVVRTNYQRSADRGRFPQEEVDQRMDRLTGTLEMSALADCDLIIEAVFENLDLRSRSSPSWTRSRSPARSWGRTPRGSISTRSRPRPRGRAT